MRVGPLRQQGSRRKFGSVVCFLSEQRGWEELGRWETAENRIREEEGFGVVQVE